MSVHTCPSEALLYSRPRRWSRRSWLEFWLARVSDVVRRFLKDRKVQGFVRYLITAVTLTCIAYAISSGSGSTYLSM